MPKSMRGMHEANLDKEPSKDGSSERYRTDEGGMTGRSEKLIDNRPEAGGGKKSDGDFDG